MQSDRQEADHMGGSAGDRKINRYCPQFANEQSEAQGEKKTAHNPTAGARSETQVSQTPGAPTCPGTPSSALHHGKGHFLLFAQQ